MFKLVIFVIKDAFIKRNIIIPNIWREKGQMIEDWFSLNWDLNKKQMENMTIISRHYCFENDSSKFTPV